MPMKTPYDFLSLFSGICSLAGMMAAENGCSFRARIPEGLAGCTLCPRERLRHILLNICLYAASYTDKSGVSLAVKKIADGRELYFSFIFSADGLDFGQAGPNRLFSFIDLGGRRNFALTVASMLALAQGGKLDVSPDGICLRLPFSEAAVCREGLPGRLVLANDIRVLLVDDWEINLLLMRENIKMLGVWADTAGSGRCCLNKLAEGNRYDIIFMDYMMPELDGVETAKLIRSLDRKDIKDIPIIAMTAEDETEQAKFLAAGMNGCLFKPAGRRQILDALKKWLPAEKSQNLGWQELCLAWRDFDALRDFPSLDCRRGLLQSGGLVADYILFLKNFLFYAPRLVYYLKYLAKEENFAPLLYTVKDCHALLACLTAPALAQKAVELHRHILRGDLREAADKVAGFCGELNDFSRKLARRLTFEQ